MRRACAALGGNNASELDLIIASATTSDDTPLPEKSVWALAAALSSSPTASRAFALSFTRRFGRTRSRRAALKCLLLLHRFLRTLPSGHPFASGLLRCRSNALISVHSRLASPSRDDLSLFLLSYSRLLDEVLTLAGGPSVCVPREGEARGQPSAVTFRKKVEETERAMELLRQLQDVVDRAMSCRPSGGAERSFLVQSAMRQVARESFVCYAEIQKELVVMLDGIPDMPHHSCVAGLGVYRRAAEQAGRLTEFYGWCREVGVCGTYEYPLVERIPQIQVRAVESFFGNMWQVTEESPSLSSSSCSSPNLTEAGVNGGRREAVVSMEWERFEEEEEKPLIQFVECDESGWEAVLDASVDWRRDCRSLID